MTRTDIGGEDHHEPASDFHVRPATNEALPVVPSSRSNGDQVNYTVFIRLPFPRGSFEDPPLVDWNISKDQSLWKILSENPRSAVIDWNELATRFQVTLPFILQQAAWLYERNFALVREQMKNIGKSGPTASAHTAGPARALSSQPMQRLGSRDSAKVTFGSNRDSPNDSSLRATPTLRDRPTSRGYQGSSTEASSKPFLTRTASTNTITQSRQTPAGGTEPPPTISQELSSAAETSYQRPLDHDSTPPSPSTRTSSSPASSSSESGYGPQTLRSQVLRRPSRFASDRVARSRNAAASFLAEDDEEDEDLPAFLPFSGPATQRAINHHPQTQARRPDAVQSLPRRQATATNSSQTTGNALARATVKPSATNVTAPARLQMQAAATASPTAVPPVQSPHRRNLAVRELSDGASSASPVTSSFSDLDDASVTRSALESALLSNIGGLGSRMSNISQAPRYA